MQYVTVFLGSSPGIDTSYREKVISLAKQCAKHKTGIVYGGSNLGLMGVLAQTVLSEGGNVISVIPEHLHKSQSHLVCTQEFIVSDMHERKAKMHSLCTGYIVLPGGLGTLDELFETMTWYQLGLHSKPIGLYNVNNYYEKLLGFLENVTSSGFMHSKHMEMLTISDDPADLVEGLLKKTSA